MSKIQTKKYYRINQEGKSEFSDTYNEQLGFIGRTDQFIKSNQAWFLTDKKAADKIPRQRFFSLPLPVKKFSPEEFADTIFALAELHKKKNHDYAGGIYLSDLIASNRAGIPAWKNALLRIQQKMSRLESFAKQGEFAVAGEKLEDTCEDLAVYSIIMLMLYKYKK